MGNFEIPEDFEQRWCAELKRHDAALQTTEGIMVHLEAEFGVSCCERHIAADQAKDVLSLLAICRILDVTPQTMRDQLHRGMPRVKEIMLCFDMTHMTDVEELRRFISSIWPDDSDNIDNIDNGVVVPAAAGGGGGGGTAAAVIDAPGFEPGAIALAFMDDTFSAALDTILVDPDNAQQIPSLLLPPNCPLPPGTNQHICTLSNEARLALVVVGMLIQHIPSLTLECFLDTAYEELWADTDATTLLQNCGVNSLAELRNMLIPFKLTTSSLPRDPVLLAILGDDYLLETNICTPDDIVNMAARDFATFKRTLQRLHMQPKAYVIIDTTINKPMLVGDLGKVMDCAQKLVELSRLHQATGRLIDALVDGQATLNDIEVLLETHRETFMASYNPSATQVFAPCYATLDDAHADEGNRKLEHQLHLLLHLDHHTDQLCALQQDIGSQVNDEVEVTLARVTSRLRPPADHRIKGVVCTDSSLLGAAYTTVFNSSTVRGMPPAPSPPCPLLDVVEIGLSLDRDYFTRPANEASLLYDAKICPVVVMGGGVEGGDVAFSARSLGRRAGMGTQQSNIELLHVQVDEAIGCIERKGCTAEPNDRDWVEEIKRILQRGISVPFLNVALTNPSRSGDWIVLPCSPCEMYVNKRPFWRVALLMRPRIKHVEEDVIELRRLVLDRLSPGFLEPGRVLAQMIKFLATERQLAPSHTQPTPEHVRATMGTAEFEALLGTISGKLICSPMFRTLHQAVVAIWSARLGIDRAVSQPLMFPEDKVKEAYLDTVSGSTLPCVLIEESHMATLRWYIKQSGRPTPSELIEARSFDKFLDTLSERKYCSIPSEMIVTFSEDITSAHLNRMFLFLSGVFNARIFVTLTPHLLGLIHDVDVPEQILKWSSLTHQGNTTVRTAYDDAQTFSSVLTVTPLSKHEVAQLDDDSSPLASALWSRLEHRLHRVSDESIVKSLSSWITSKLKLQTGMSQSTLVLLTVDQQYVHTLIDKLQQTLRGSANHVDIVDPTLQAINSLASYAGSSVRVVFSADRLSTDTKKRLCMRAPGAAVVHYVFVSQSRVPSDILLPNVFILELDTSIATLSQSISLAKAGTAASVSTTNNNNNNNKSGGSLGVGNVASSRADPRRMLAIHLVFGSVVRLSLLYSLDDQEALLAHLSAATQSVSVSASRVFLDELMKLCIQDSLAFVDEHLFKLNVREETRIRRLARIIFLCATVAIAKDVEPISFEAFLADPACQVRSFDARVLLYLYYLRRFLSVYYPKAVFVTDDETFSWSAVLPPSAHLVDSVVLLNFFTGDPCSSSYRATPRGAVLTGSQEDQYANLAARHLSLPWSRVSRDAAFPSTMHVLEKVLWASVEPVKVLACCLSSSLCNWGSSLHIGSLTTTRCQGMPASPELTRLAWSFAGIVAFLTDPTAVAPVAESFMRHSAVIKFIMALNGAVVLEIAKILQQSEALLKQALRFTSVDFDILLSLGIHFSLEMLEVLPLDMKIMLIAMDVGLAANPFTTQSGLSMFLARSESTGLLDGTDNSPTTETRVEVGSALIEFLLNDMATPNDATHKQSLLRHPFATTLRQIMISPDSILQFLGEGDNDDAIEPYAWCSNDKFDVEAAQILSTESISEEEAHNASLTLGELPSFGVWCALTPDSFGLLFSLCTSESQVVFCLGMLARVSFAKEYSEARLDKVLSHALQAVQPSSSTDFELVCLLSQQHPGELLAPVVASFHRLFRSPVEEDCIDVNADITTTLLHFCNARLSLTLQSLLTKNIKLFSDAQQPVPVEYFDFAMAALLEQLTDAEVGFPFTKDNVDSVTSRMKQLMLLLTPLGFQRVQQTIQSSENMLTTHRGLLLIAWLREPMFNIELDDTLVESLDAILNTAATADFVDHVHKAPTVVCSLAQYLVMPELLSTTSCNHFNKIFKRSQIPVDIFVVTQRRTLIYPPYVLLVSHREVPAEQAELILDTITVNEWEDSTTLTPGFADLSFDQQLKCFRLDIDSGLHQQSIVTNLKALRHIRTLKMIEVNGHEEADPLADRTGRMLANVVWTWFRCWGATFALLERFIVRHTKEKSGYLVDLVEPMLQNYSVEIGDAASHFPLPALIDTTPVLPSITTLAGTTVEDVRYTLARFNALINRCPPSEDRQRLLGNVTSAMVASTKENANMPSAELNSSRLRICAEYLKCVTREFGAVVAKDACQIYREGQEIREPANLRVQRAYDLKELQHVLTPFVLLLRQLTAIDDLTSAAIRIDDVLSNFVLSARDTIERDESDVTVKEVCQAILYRAVASVIGVSSCSTNNHWLICRFHSVYVKNHMCQCRLTLNEHNWANNKDFLPIDTSLGPLRFSANGSPGVECNKRMIRSDPGMAVLTPHIVKQFTSRTMRYTRAQSINRDTFADTAPPRNSRSKAESVYKETFSSPVDPAAAAAAAASPASTFTTEAEGDSVFFTASTDLVDEGNRTRGGLSVVSGVGSSEHHTDEHIALVRKLIEAGEGLVFDCSEVVKCDFDTIDNIRYATIYVPNGGSIFLTHNRSNNNMTYWSLTATPRAHPGTVVKREFSSHSDAWGFLCDMSNKSVLVLGECLLRKQHGSFVPFTFDWKSVRKTFIMFTESRNLLGHQNLLRESAWCLLDKMCHLLMAQFVPEGAHKALFSDSEMVSSFIRHVYYPHLSKTTVAIQQRKSFDKLMITIMRYTVMAPLISKSLRLVAQYVYSHLSTGQNTVNIITREQLRAGSADVWRNITDTLHTSCDCVDDDSALTSLVECYAMYRRGARINAADQAATLSTNVFKTFLNILKTISDGAQEETDPVDALIGFARVQRRECGGLPGLELLTSDLSVLQTLMQTVDAAILSVGGVSDGLMVPRLLFAEFREHLLERLPIITVNDRIQLFRLFQRKVLPTALQVQTAILYTGVADPHEELDEWAARQVFYQLQLAGDGAAAAPVAAQLHPAPPLPGVVLELVTALRELPTHDAANAATLGNAVNVDVLDAMSPEVLRARLALRERVREDSNVFSKGGEIGADDSGDGYNDGLVITLLSAQARVPITYAMFQSRHEIQQLEVKDDCKRQRAVLGFLFGKITLPQPEQTLGLEVLGETKRLQSWRNWMIQVMRAPLRKIVQNTVMSMILDNDAGQGFDRLAQPSMTELIALHALTELTFDLDMPQRSQVLKQSLGCVQQVPNERLLARKGHKYGMVVQTQAAGRDIAWELRKKNINVESLDMREMAETAGVTDELLFNRIIGGFASGAVIVVVLIDNMSNKCYKWCAEHTRKNPWRYIFFVGLHVHALLPENIDRTSFVDGMGDINLFRANNQNNSTVQMSLVSLKPIESVEDLPLPFATHLYQRAPEEHEVDVDPAAAVNATYTHEELRASPAVLQQFFRSRRFASSYSRDWFNHAGGNISSSADFALVGPPGIGKTYLLNELLRERVDLPKMTIDASSEDMCNQSLEAFVQEQVDVRREFNKPLLVVIDESHMLEVERLHMLLVLLRRYEINVMIVLISNRFDQEQTELIHQHFESGMVLNCGNAFERLSTVFDDVWAGDQRMCSFFEVFARGLRLIFGEDMWSFRLLVNKKGTILEWYSLYGDGPNHEHFRLLAEMLQSKVPLQSRFFLETVCQQLWEYFLEAHRLESLHAAVVERLPDVENGGVSVARALVHAALTASLHNADTALSYPEFTRRLAQPYSTHAAVKIAMWMLYCYALSDAYIENAPVFVAHVGGVLGRLHDAFAACDAPDTFPRLEVTARPGNAQPLSSWTHNGHVLCQRVDYSDLWAVNKIVERGFGVDHERLQQALRTNPRVDPQQLIRLAERLPFVLTLMTPDHLRALMLMPISRQHGLHERVFVFLQGNEVDALSHHRKSSFMVASWLLYCERRCRTEPPTVDAIGRLMWHVVVDEHTVAIDVTVLFIWATDNAYDLLGFSSQPTKLFALLKQDLTALSALLVEQMGVVAVITEQTEANARAESALVVLFSGLFARLAGQCCKSWQGHHALITSCYPPRANWSPLLQHMSHAWHCHLSPDGALLLDKNPGFWEFVKNLHHAVQSNYIKGIVMVRGGFLPYSWQLKILQSSVSVGDELADHVSRFSWALRRLKGAAATEHNLSIQLPQSSLFYQCLKRYEAKLFHEVKFVRHLVLALADMPPPVHCVFLIDTSHSMLGKKPRPTHEDFRKGNPTTNNAVGCVFEKIRFFINMRVDLGTNDMFSLVFYNTDVHMPEESLFVRTPELARINDVLRSYKVQRGQGTSFAPALHAAAEQLQKGAQRNNHLLPVVLFLTDGVDPHLVERDPRTGELMVPPPSHDILKKINCSSRTLLGRLVTRPTVFPVYFQTCEGAELVEYSVGMLRAVTRAFTKMDDEDDEDDVTVLSATSNEELETSFKSIAADLANK